MSGVFPFALSELPISSKKNTAATDTKHGIWRTESFRPDVYVQFTLKAYSQFFLAVHAWKYIVYSLPACEPVPFTKESVIFPPPPPKQKTPGNSSIEMVRP